MFAMPYSGYLYVMAGGYGVNLFGVLDLPNPIGTWPALAFVAKWIHILASYALLLALAGHLGLVLRHHLILKDGLLYRMLPGSRARQVVPATAPVNRKLGQASALTRRERQARRVLGLLRLTQPCLSQLRHCVGEAVPAGGSLGEVGDHTQPQARAWV